MPGLVFTAPGLTASPQAATASPAARMFFAALMSRSWTTPHSGQFHERSSSVSESRICPQSKQRLEDGYHLSILTRWRPYHLALYSNWDTNSLQPTSLMALLNFWFLTMFFTARSSTQIVWFSRIRRVESLCEKSRRRSVMRAWILATFLRAFSRFLLPFFFLACRR